VLVEVRRELNERRRRVVEVGVQVRPARRRLEGAALDFVDQCPHDEIPVAVEPPFATDPADAASAGFMPGDRDLAAVDQPSDREAHRAPPLALPCSARIPCLTGVS